MSHNNDLTGSLTATDLPAVYSAIKLRLALFTLEGEHLGGGGRLSAITSSNVSKVIRVIVEYALLCAERVCVVCC